ncbi:dienelactone hydrolase family protein [Hydrogenophaga sp. 5NK40-0174]|uniref:dienelactone hydrolase family protein n=1 Tax=Hydrogenophaga sp. 5NK40-0174 TaxID=3127649 RepID=UPI0031060C7F
MGKFVDLTSSDGFTFPAYVAEPSGPAKSGLVVLQEIFGVNSHIRAVADGYAADGYLVVAPSTFHRAKQGVELGYSEDDMKTGFGLKTAVEELPPPGVMVDIQAAINHAASAGKVGIVGYCWGGLLSWRSACQLKGLAAAVTYYGGGMTVDPQLSMQAQVPVLSHFGDQDHWITLDTVEAFRQGHPDVEVHVYKANHGFNCDQRGAYNAEAAKLARERTLAFWAKHLA